MSEKIKYKRQILKMPWDKIKPESKNLLMNARKHLPNLLTFTIEPKVEIHDFVYDKFAVFKSK